MLQSSNTHELYAIMDNCLVDQRDGFVWLITSAYVTHRVDLPIARTVIMTIYFDGDCKFSFLGSTGDAFDDDYNNVEQKFKQWHN